MNFLPPTPPMYTPSENVQGQIRRSFTYHAPHGTQPARYEQLRDKAREFAELLARLTPASREQSLALTHLEDAVMCANAAIARNEG